MDSIYKSKFNAAPLKTINLHNVLSERCKPTGVAHCPVEDILYIADHNNNRVLISSLQGRYIRLLGGYEEPVEFDRPFDIATGENGNVYITEGGTGRVRVYSHDGEKRDWAGPKLQEISGIACHGGMVYVVDYRDKSVYQFTADGQLVQEFGSWILESPWYITVGGPGNMIYVSQNGKDDIAVFDSGGNFVKECGRKPPIGATGITVDKDGFVCVARPTSKSVEVYDPEQKFLCSFGENSNAHPGLLYPFGMCQLPDKRVVVCDYEDSCLQIF